MNQLTNLFTAFFLLFTVFDANATLWIVNEGADFETPNQLYLADQIGDIDIADGDSIYIFERTYSGTEALAAWQQNQLYIYSLGEGATLNAAGENILGKGIWVLAGDNITVENINFTNATVPDENGAGIRLDGIGMTIRHCEFYNNENGILIGNTYDGDVLVEHTRFTENGFGDGYTHNIYVGHINSFTMQFCLSERANVGHNIKSRANTNHILYNLLIDGETGNSSRLIDIPNGGPTLILGNALMKGLMAINGNLVGYGLEGLSNPAPHNLLYVHNTALNYRVASALFIDVEEGTEELYIANNVFAGTGTVIADEFTFYANNYETTDIEECQFEMVTEFNYRLQPDSPLRDYGLDLADELIPHFAYSHWDDFESRTEFGSAPDAGAYELIPPVSISQSNSLTFEIYPNPTTDVLHISTDQNIEKIEIYSLNGKLILSSSAQDQIMEIQQLPTGIYFVKVQVTDAVITKSLTKK